MVAEAPSVRFQETFGNTCVKKALGISRNGPGDIWGVEAVEGVEEVEGVEAVEEVEGGGGLGVLSHVCALKLIRQKPNPATMVPDIWPPVLRLK